MVIGGKTRGMNGGGRGQRSPLSLSVQGSNKTSNQRAKKNVETLMHSEWLVVS